ncbi:hypothetical protein SULAZ_1170 [Sulfurihydrogenibium azorense Az-Fu1]|jgi:hypothetical protein|uniref:Uncharacterized protein n=1 Tax=Sulfurihydrogenibium azorense (strain DSM 15241 / OCM 825 / Az-Fu1) TaxID=204536 RepID=C1DVK4_SULAA|nr:hypothetical protein [Sulfurihydrogenibium azorense]ACN98946.1 hypothetical protein SULAZ_1170 [Sulfurihydrogenibium azorense Az-Fu1]MDM7274329.1 hypothetical protein [Sulfurihydrogenibium azorense]
MAKIKEIQLITKLLNELIKIKGIENIELINIPDDVEADVGLRIRLRNNYDWIEVNHKISDIIWALFEKTGEYITVYREFDNSVDKIVESF